MSDRRREPAPPQLLAALRRDPIRRPRRREAEPHLHLVRQLHGAQALPDLQPHDVDGGTAHEGRQQLDREPLPALRPRGERHRADHAQLDQADGRDLGIGDLVQRRPDGSALGSEIVAGAHHVAAASERATIVNWPCSQAKSSVRRERPSSAGRADASGAGRPNACHGGHYLLEPPRPQRGQRLRQDAGLDQGGLAGERAEDGLRVGPQAVEARGQPFTRLAACLREAPQPDVEMQQVIASPRDASSPPARPAARTTSAISASRRSASACS